MFWFGVLMRGDSFVRNREKTVFELAFICVYLRLSAVQFSPAFALVVQREFDGH